MNTWTSCLRSVPLEQNDLVQNLMLAFIYLLYLFRFLKEVSQSLSAFDYLNNLKISQKISLVLIDNSTNRKTNLKYSASDSLLKH
jgi:hypothetical protein